MDAYETEAGLATAKEQVESLRADQIPAQVLTSSEVRKFEPGIGDGIVGGVFFSEAGHVDPQDFLSAGAAAVKQEGGHIRLGVEALALRMTQSVVTSVETTAGMFYPDIVIIAAGVWSSRLSRGLGAYIPLEGGKGYHIDFSPRPDDPRIPILVHESRIAVIPSAQRLRVSGAFELDGFDNDFDRIRVGAILATARRDLKHIDKRAVLDLWRGFRPCSPDGLPYIGTSRRVSNVIFATGHTRAGVALAPITGRLVTEIVTHKQPSLDLAPFDPDRFRALWPTRQGSAPPRHAAWSSFDAIFPDHPGAATHALRLDETKPSGTLPPKER
jgi:D-amino-acid dehydrogenase